MIAPIFVEFENFLSFQKRQVFNFQTQGIHYIFGINHDADVDMNDFTADSYNVGVGKSSLALALEYAFYGDTQRRVNKDQIINKSSGKNLYVGLEFEVTSTGDKYFIKRYRRHDDFRNRLMLLRWNGKKYDDISGVDKTQTQEFIDKIVVLDMKTFEKTSLLTREDKFQFLELPILNRGMIFENISQINKFKDYWWKAKTRYKATEDRIIDLNNEILKESTIITRDKKYIDEIKKNESSKRKELQSIIKQYEDELEELVSSNIPIDTILQNMVVYKKLQMQKVDADDKIKAQQNIQLMYEREVQSVKKDINELMVELEKAKQKVDNFKPKKCHNCGAVQEPEQYEKDFRELVMHRESVDGKMTSKTNVLMEVQGRMSTANGKYDELYAAREQYLTEMKEVELPEFVKEAIDNGDAETINNIRHANTNIQTQKSILDSIDNTKAINQLLKEIGEHQTALNKVNAQKADVLKQQEIYQFWLNVLDFKSENSLKQFVISKIIPLFNNFVQQMIDVVYKGNLIIAFDNFFNETIYYQGEEWKYEELSTGEKMKLNFCINLAIFDLTRVNMDSCGVIFLDEIFTNVDTPTVIEFLDIIRERYAKKNGVYIISHEQKVRDNLKPDTTILIEKRNKNSEITKIEVVV